MSSNISFTAFFETTQGQIVHQDIVHCLFVLTVCLVLILLVPSPMSSRILISARCRSSHPAVPWITCSVSETVTLGARVVIENIESVNGQEKYYGIIKEVVRLEKEWIIIRIIGNRSARGHLTHVSPILLAIPRHHIRLPFLPYLRYRFGYSSLPDLHQFVFGSPSAVSPLTPDTLPIRISTTSVTDFLPDLEEKNDEED